MKFTEEQCEKFLQALNEVKYINAHYGTSFLEIMSNWIAANLKPEQIYDGKTLEKWAEDVGFTYAPYIDSNPPNTNPFGVTGQVVMNSEPLTNHATKVGEGTIMTNNEVITEKLPDDPPR